MSKRTPLAQTTPFLPESGRAAPGPASGTDGEALTHTSASPSLSDDDARQLRMLELEITLLELALAAERRRPVVVPRAAGRWLPPGHVDGNVETRSHYLSPGEPVREGRWLWRLSAEECASAVRRQASAPPPTRGIDVAQMRYREAVESRRGDPSPSTLAGAVG